MERLRQHLRRRRSSSSSPGLRRHSEVEETPRRLYITSDTPAFDEDLLCRIRAEGFDVEYLPFLNETDDIEQDRKELERLIREREDDLEPEERFAVVAYKRPAFLLLLSHHQSTATNPFPRLCAFVAYYPNPPEESLGCRLPPSTTSSTTSSCYDMLPLLPIQIHLAGHQSQALWENTTIHPSKTRHRCHLFYYPESNPGFAESVMPGYDRISSRLAWSRSLGCIKRGFGWPNGNWRTPDPESVWERYWKNIFRSSRPREYDKGAHTNSMLKLMVGRGDPNSEHSAHINCVPSTIGGSTPFDISKFYSSQFIPSGPPSQLVRLLSRTVGPDRVVDELLLTFEHTEEIPWLLPDVPPTGRSVRIVLVMSVSFVAGNIARHNIYWDQASVLVQIGLLDPALIPPSFQPIGPNRIGKTAVERVPVVGGEAVDAVITG